MGLITITEMIDILKRNFIRVFAFSLAVGILTMWMTNNAQTYTCTLNYRYNYNEAEQGLAPDRKTSLDPYQLQEPVVIKAALNEMGYGEDDGMDVEEIRSNIVISEVVETLEKEVADSAASRGEKYDISPVEFKIGYTYDSSWGTEFGTKFFDKLIKQYDDYLLSEYYNKREIADFAKIIDEEKEEYLEIADLMSENIDSIVEYFSSMAESYPDFRSKRTGFSFSEISYIYQNLRNIQYAKYYGNIRAGKLTKDLDMVIQNYSSKIVDLTYDDLIQSDIAKEYLDSIEHFYDSYKKTSLYTQAQNMQGNLENTNQRENGVIENDYLERYINTYDKIVERYADSATVARIHKRDIQHYRSIIEDFKLDDVTPATKQRLLDKNKVIFDEISTLSKEYSEIANTTLDEHFDNRVNNDLLYLISTDVRADKPVAVYVIFAFIVSFGFVYVILVILKLIDKSSDKNDYVSSDEELDEAKMSELQNLFYKQYQNGFNELYLVYQPMIECKTGESSEYEAFIRWRSEQYGAVPAMKIIDCAKELNLLEALNSWIIDKICENLSIRRKNHERMPVIHINCPTFAVKDFGLADIIVEHTSKYNIDTKYICMEIDSEEVISALPDLLLLQKIGAKICVDRFEGSVEQEEIFKVLLPNYIKLSVDVVNSDTFATSPGEFFKAEMAAIRYILDVLDKCKSSGIKACICGIENEEQEKNFVNDVGFAFKQGYYYGKPMRYEAK